MWIFFLCVAAHHVKWQIDMQMSNNASLAPDCTSQNQWDSEPRHKGRLKSMGFDMDNCLPPPKSAATLLFLPVKTNRQIKDGGCP